MRLDTDVGRVEANRLMDAVNIRVIDGNRSALTTVLLRTRVSPTVSECAY